MNKKVGLLIIGGGPAGLSAAVSAYKNGINDLLILERDVRLGGILNQCIHNGFGLHTFKEELTGPEYAGRFIDQVLELGIPYKLGTIVTDLVKANDSDAKIVTAMSADEGLVVYEADAVILAMGCRERPRGALNTPGERPSGIYTAGTAQYFVNIEGRMPGKEVVILGSGDIGLIMARRMTLEGAHVKLVAELMPYSGGLKRNIVQCLDDYGIPLLLSHTVVKIHGDQRLTGVTIAQVDEKSAPIPGTEKFYECDTLLLSCGLLPENELSGQCGVSLSPVTSGAIVNESLETSVPGVFACGNVLHVHDLVDYVSEEAASAGIHAAGYLNRIEEPAQNLEDAGNADVCKGVSVKVVTDGGVRYSVPSVIRVDYMDELTKIRFRVGSVFKESDIVIYLGDKELSRLHKRVMAPGEMETVIIRKSDLAVAVDGDALKITIEKKE